MNIEIAVDEVFKKLEHRELKPKLEGRTIISVNNIILKIYITDIESEIHLVMYKEEYLSLGALNLGVIINNDLHAKGPDIEKLTVDEIYTLAKIIVAITKRRV